MPLRTPFAPKHVVCKLERAHLRMRHALVIDDVLLSNTFDRLLQAGSTRAGKFRNRIYVDVERVEKEAAVRGIRAGILRLCIKQGVQRVAPAAPRSAARSIRAARSVKSPCPQLRRDLTP